MIQNFEIVKVLDLNNSSQFIFARQVDVGLDFEVKESSMLGGVHILQYFDMPRVLDDNQQQRQDVFVFRPINRLPAGYFKEGELVEFVTPD